jgi:beta-galactosidase
LKTFGIQLATFILLSATGCATLPTRLPPSSNQLIDTHWRFLRQDVPNAQAVHFNDSHWDVVDLPHTYNALDGQDGGSNYYRGPAWYRYHFDLSHEEISQRIYLRFEAASLKAAVYVNGQPAGLHRGAFTAFCFNINPYLHPGNNLIAVRIDNSFDPDIPPIAGDFNICGGIYRDVHLLFRNSICISPTDDGSPGVYLTPLQVDANSASVQCAAELRNDSDTAHTVRVSCKIKLPDDFHDAPITYAIAQQTIPSHGIAEARLTLTIPHPHLWNGRDDPFLYRAQVEISEGQTHLDSIDQPLGLRYFTVDPQQGFFLNGHHLPLHGVAFHQDFWNRGWAIRPQEIDQSYDLIQEMGANAVRLVHYPRSNYEYSRCDKDGLIVWTEIPLVNRIKDTPAFTANSAQQLREMIKQNYNHPSICFWGIFNELGPHTRTDWPLAVHMNELAHQLDPTRLTICASYHPADHPLNWITDLTGLNRYYLWYGDPSETWEKDLDKMHLAFPAGKICVSEYGAGAGLLYHEAPTSRPYVKGPWHPEEWQAYTHEKALESIETRPWIFATYILSMFDFASDARHEGDRAGQNDKGLVTADRLIRKDAFYFYKANWTTQPFVYIASRRWTPRLPGPADLKVYSNCDRVELFLNGQSLGPKRSADHIFRWPAVPLALGNCTLWAIGEKSGLNYTDRCHWLISSVPSTRPATTQHWIQEPVFDPLQ